MGGLVALEVLGRRIQLIQEAYGNPARPSWDAARLFSGVSGMDGGISPALHGWVSKRANEEADITLARAREARGALPASAMAAAAAVGDAQTSGGLAAGSGGGKGAGGGKCRQPAPPAAPAP